MTQLLKSVQQFGCDPPQDLFPLPLTVFEQLMLEDDLPDFPKLFTVVVDFEGEMDRAAFEIAARETVRRNPLLCSRVARKHSRWHWMPGQFSEDQISWNSSNRDREHTWIDLRKQSGFHLAGWTDGTASQIRLTFHHAVSDGQGSRRVIIDWSTIYSLLMGADPKRVSLDDLNYDLLRDRGIFTRDRALEMASMPTASNSVWQRLKAIYEFFAHQPVALRPKIKVTSATAHHAHLNSVRFDRSDVDRFRTRLRGTSIGLNDVAIALLLNLIAKWNRAHGETGIDRLYRILVPVDLREGGDDFLPASNRMSFIFLTRPTSLCLDFPRLLGTIRAEMDYIERHGSKYNLIRALPMLQSIPWAVPLGAKAPLCFSTAVLTNLGNTIRNLRHRHPHVDGRPLVGNLHYVRSSGVPPLRSKTRVGIGITFSAHEAVFECKMDSRTFSAECSDAFLASYAESWRHWAANSGDFQS